MHPWLYFPTSELEEHELFCPRFTTNPCKLTLKSRVEIGNTMVRSILHNAEWTKAFQWVCLQSIVFDHKSPTEVSFLDNRQRRPSYLTTPHIKACIFSLVSNQSQQLSAKETKYFFPCSWCLFVYTIETQDTHQARSPGGWGQSELTKWLRQTDWRVPWPPKTCS